MCIRVFVVYFLCFIYGDLANYQFHNTLFILLRAYRAHAFSRNGPDVHNSFPAFISPSLFSNVVGDTDFINILTEDVNLNILPGTKLTPGVSFVKPLTSTSMSFDIIVDTFHIEGTETEPEVTTEYPEPLLPIECNSVYGGEVILEKPDVNFPIIPPIKDVTMCEVAKNANLTLTVDAPASVQSRGDIITYKIQVENNSSQRAENVIVYNSVTNAERLSATGDTFLFTSGSALSAGSTHSVEFSYIVNGTEGEEHQTTTTVTSLYDEPKSVQTAVPIKLDQFKFKIDTNKFIKLN